MPASGRGEKEEIDTKNFIVSKAIILMDFSRLIGRRQAQQAKEEGEEGKEQEPK